MQGFIVVAGMIGGLFALAVLMLRQARRVRDQAYRSTRAPRAEQPWQEAVTTEDGLTLSRDASHNEELLGMGEGARQHKWTITHQS
jgi:cell division protein FtsW (lipid II flippase)